MGFILAKPKNPKISAISFFLSFPFILVFQQLQPLSLFQHLSTIPTTNCCRYLIQVIISLHLSGSLFSSFITSSNPRLKAKKHLTCCHLRWWFLGSGRRWVRFDGFKSVLDFMGFKKHMRDFCFGGQYRQDDTVKRKRMELSGSHGGGYLLCSQSVQKWWLSFGGQDLGFRLFGMFNDSGKERLLQAWQLVVCSNVRELMRKKRSQRLGYFL